MTQENVLHFGEFAFHAQTRELYKGQHRIRLPASQLRLLVMFLERPGHLISREEIGRRLWTDTSTIDVERGINTAINSLRTTLGDTFAEPRFVETTIGLGYRFITPVEVREESAVKPGGDPPSPVGGNIASLFATEASTPMPASYPPPLPNASMATVSAGPRPGLRRRFILWTAAAGGLLLLAVWFARVYRPASLQTADVPQTAEFEPATFDYGKNQVTASAVSPDGQTLAYADDTGISLHRFDNGADTTMNSERGWVIHHMAWLPNSPKLLVSATDTLSGKHEAWLIGLDDYYALDLPDASGAEPSPDGASIAFTRREGRELWTATIQGDSPHRLPVASDGEIVKFVLWSRDGHYLLLSGYRAEVAKDRNAAPPANRWFYRTVDTRSGKVLVDTPGVEISSGFLMPDGTLHFINQQTPIGIVVKTDTVEMKVATQSGTGGLLGTPILAEEIPGRPAFDLSASLDGSRQAVVSSTIGLEVSLAQLSADGTTLTAKALLTHGVMDAYPHDWTQDGNVLFERGSNGRHAIFSQRENSDDMRLIAKLGIDLFSPQLSADGRWILFLGRQHGSNSLYRVPVAGGTPERVPIAGDVKDFHCPAKATTTCVVSEYVGRKAFAYYALDPLSGLGKELVQTPWRSDHLGDWSLSLDGTEIAVADDSVTNPGVELIALTRSAPTHRFVSLPGHGTVLEATWAANGKALYVECRTELGYSLIYKSLLDDGATGGQERVIASSPNLLYAIPSPDGKKLALPIPNLTTNVWTKLVR